MCSWSCDACADAATPARVVALLGDGMATVESGPGERADVSVDLVAADLGDVVLVHAGVAIGKVQ